MRNYIPKQHGCPYRTSDGQCTHRYRGLNTTHKKKRLCPYNNEDKCEMYLEWFEIIKSCDNVSKDVRELSGKEGEL